MNIKEQRGLELASKSKITNKNGLWFVPSQSGKKRYKVEIKETNQRCDCPDFEFRQITCKHIFAVQFVIQQKETKTEIKDGKTTVTETVVTKRVSYIYAIASDDLLPTSAPRSRLYRVSPTNGLATQIGDPAGITLTTGRGGDQNPYFDGLAILPDGRAFGSEARFTNNPVQSGDPLVADNGGMYRIFLTGPNVGKATFTKYLLPTDVNRDTGLANNGFSVFLLLEDARVYTTTADAATPVIPAVFPSGNPAGSNVLATPGCLRPIAFPGQPCGDLEGFDIPNNGNGLR